MVEAPGVESAGFAESPQKQAVLRPGDAAVNTTEHQHGQKAAAIPAAIPAGKLTADDLVRAADAAALAGNLHAVRRLLAELAERVQSGDESISSGEGGRS